MNTTRQTRYLPAVLFALPIVVALLGAGLAQAAAPRVEQLPRVVVSGQSLQAKAAAQVRQLPRVVVVGQSNGGSTAALACAQVKSATQVC
ncbi:hypothetical protein [Roseateles toxinivorans]|uniref:Alpha/beta hydrolase family protein n=1 Tax=Roseateles toxinivorans TaxID=270368 RepID=A0A4R6QMV8_9BURK|nr:hypothetical protein [Roseateles toxinivorans]TDP63781.1 hypothetical protein DES47_10463 [Roseateles toxinivorans]